MAISPRDSEFMQEVGEYFKGTVSDSQPEGSIRETAKKYKITRTKVKKILVTQGVLNTPLVQRIAGLRKLGMNVDEIASELGMAASTVSTYLPYGDKMDRSLDPSPHAAEVREYRSYERQQLRRQAKLKAQGDHGEEEKPLKAEWSGEEKMSFTETFHRPHRETWVDSEEIRKRLEEQFNEEERALFSQMTADLNEMRAQEAEDVASLRSLPPDAPEAEALKKKHGFYPGALSSRNQAELEQLYGGRLPFEPMSVMRLHLELCSSSGRYSASPVDNAVSDILHQYGGVFYGDTISRDIVIPSDLPLYALHYVLQKTFGWRNAKRHRFFIPLERVRLLCHDNVSMWSCMVGLLFRSPLMDSQDEFWLDDYAGGSFKNWLRKKYTGPYLSQNESEGLVVCQEQMMELDMNEEFCVCYEKNESGEEHPVALYCKEGNRAKPKRQDGQPYARIRTARLEALNVDEMTCFFKQDPFALIERLPLDCVIAAGDDKLSDCLTQEEKESSGLCETGAEMHKAVGRYIRRVIEAYENSPQRQVVPVAFTDVLYYVYGEWTVKITASNNCPDLKERISQNSLDRANLKCRDTYRPVLIVRDGLPVFDQAENLEGYCRFLKDINPDLDVMPKDQQGVAKRLRREKLDWAQSQGWQRDDSSDMNFL